jgi:hypothetical protein
VIAALRPLVRSTSESFAQETQARQYRLSVVNALGGCSLRSRLISAWTLGSLLYGTKCIVVIAKSVTLYFRLTAQAMVAEGLEKLDTVMTSRRNPQLMSFPSYPTAIWSPPELWHYDLVVTCWQIGRIGDRTAGYVFSCNREEVIIEHLSWVRLRAALHASS